MEVVSQRRGRLELEGRQDYARGGAGDGKRDRARGAMPVEFGPRVLSERLCPALPPPRRYGIIKDRKTCVRSRY